MLAAVGSFDGRVRVLDIDSEKVYLDLRGEIGPGSLVLALSPGSSALAVGSDSASFGRSYKLWV